MPYARRLDTLGTEVILDSGDYAGLLDKALAAIGWHALQRELQAAPRRRRSWSAPASRMFVEKSGLGPFDGVRIAVDDDGAVEVVTGAASVGQGIETVIAQICADALGVDYAARPRRPRPDRPHRLRHGRVRLARHGDDRRGDAARGAESCAPRRSSSPPSCCKLPPEALDIVDGEVVRNGAARGPSITLGEIARRSAPASRTRGGRAPGLPAEGWFHTDHMNYPYGVHIAVVRVDRETGARRRSSAISSPTTSASAVNPMLVEGQIVGGVAQGLGGALLEEFLYDERGEPLSVTFADYLMPTAREIPAIDVLICRGRAEPAQSAGPQRAPARAAPTRSAPPSRRRSTMPSACRARSTRLPVTPQRLRALLRRANTAS